MGTFEDVIEKLKEIDNKGLKDTIEELEDFSDKIYERITAFFDVIEKKDKEAIRKYLVDLEVFIKH